MPAPESKYHETLLSMQIVICYVTWASSGTIFACSCRIDLTYFFIFYGLDMHHHAHSLTGLQ